MRKKTHERVTYDAERDSFVVLMGKDSFWEVGADQFTLALEFAEFADWRAKQDSEQAPLI